MIKDVMERDIHVVRDDIHVRVDVCHADVRYRVR